MSTAKNKSHQILFALGGLVLLFAFQNCAPKSEIAASQASQTDSEQRSPEEAERSGQDPEVEPSTAPPPAIPQSPSAVNCLAASFVDLERCIDLSRSRGPSAGIQIVTLSQNLVLGINETIDLTGVSNLELRAASPAITITESVPRLLSGEPGNRHLIVIGADSKNLTLRGLQVIDPIGQRENLKRQCRVGAHETNPNLWNPTICYAPLLIGGVSLDGADSAEGIKLIGLKVISDKALLLELKTTKRLVIEDSTFKGGTSMGIMFHSTTPHLTSVIQRNTFEDAGTNAIIFTNATNTLFQSNRFINNHRDPQFSCGQRSGVPVFCTGGQLFLTNHSNIRDLRVLNNHFEMTDPIYLQSNSGGIEISNSGAGVGVTQNVVISGNRFENLSLWAIHVGETRHQRIKDISITNNFFEGVWKSRPQLLDAAARAVAFFSEGENTSVDYHSNWMTYPNRKNQRISLIPAQTQCRVSPTGVCAISVSYQVHGTEPPRNLTFRLNGNLVRSVSTQRSGTFSVGGIRRGPSRLTVHLDSLTSSPTIGTVILSGE